MKSDNCLAGDFEFDKMVESLLGEFPLRDWETYLLTSLTMSFFERDSKAIEILD